MDRSENRIARRPAQTSDILPDSSGYACLADAAMALLHCRTDDDVYRVIGDYVQRICPGAIVIVDEITPDMGHFVTRSIGGIDKSLVAKAADLVGFQFVGKRWPIPSAFRDELLRGTLLKIPGGFAELASNDIPRALAALITKMAGICDLYAVGIADEARALGNFAILTRTPDEVPEADLLESFARQCFAVLSELAKSRDLRRFSAALDRAPAYIYLKDKQHRYSYANASTLELFGCTEDELLGSEDSRFFPPETVARLKAVDDRVLERGEHTGEQIESVDRHGDRRVYWEVKSPVFETADSQEVWGLCGVSTDITESKRAEEALARTAELLETTAEMAKTGGWELDLRSGELTWSLQTYRIHEVDPSVEPSVAQSRAYYPPEELPRLKAMVQDAIENGTPWDYELPLVTAKGRSVWVRGHGSAVIEDGKTVALRGTFQDITERRRAEVERDRISTLLTNLVRMVPGVVYQYQLHPDGSSRFPYSSPGMWDIYEVSPEDVREDATPVFGRLHPDDLDAIVKSIEDSARTQKPYHSEFRVVLPEQGLRWRSCDANPELMDDGSTLWHGIITDITESKRAQETLARSAEEFRTLAEAMPQIVWTTRPDGWNTYFNQQWVDYTGMTLEESYGEGWSAPFHPDDQQRSQEAWARATTTGSAYEVEVRLRRADGAYRWWLVRGVPQRGPDGEILKWFGTCTDIEDLKRNAEALQASEARLAEQAARLEVLAEASRAFAEVGDDHQALLDLVARRVVENLGDMCEIRMLSGDQESLELAAIYGPDAELVESLRRLDSSVSHSADDPGLLPHVFRTGQAALVPVLDLEQLLAAVPPEFGAVYRRLTPHSYLIVQLRVQGHAIGAMALTRQRPEWPPFTEADVALAQDLADRAALAIANARLLGDVRSELALRRRGEAELRKLDMIHSTLSHVNHAIVHLRRPDELFAEVCRTIVEEGGYRAAWVGLVDPDGARVRPVAEAGAAAGYVSNVDIVLGDPKRGNGPTGICISERRHVICQDIENDPRMAPWRENALRHGYRSSASFPLTMGDATVGALTMYSDEAGFFDDQQVDLLDELAMDVSFAMEFTREETRRAQADEEILKQSERISKTLTSVIDIAGTIVEARDPYTAGHQRRVAQIATAIARELGMSDREIADIEVAGLIHDIGKVQIPAEILGKPGAITALEYAILQTHAEAGYRIVVSANMEVSISEMVYQHHERCDGSGYPRGLTAEQLLPGAKVLAVADVVEAMMSHRPYRPALGIDAALAEIERGAGTAYDAAASRACIALFRENGFELD